MENVGRCESMTNEKVDLKISEKKLKIIDHASFFEIVGKKPSKDDLYLPITRRRDGKKAFIVVQKHKQK